MNIVYEDNHVLVAVKPAGLSTQEDFEKQLQEFLKQRDQKKGNAFVYSIHRLDKPVTGLVLFAKSSKALTRLNESMRKKEIHKRYRAKIEGTLPKSKGDLIHTLEKRHQKSVVSRQGKQAKLSYQVLEDGSVDILLHTGRYHQIRAQFAAVGCPIVGDEKYGSTIPHKEGIALCHYKLSFPHPTLAEWVEVEIQPSFQ